MKVAVVTPYYKETDQQLEKCMSSVGKQSYPATHILVSDGYPQFWRAKLSNFEHMTLPVSHGDAGATPRAIGAMSAFSRGYDAVAFLDADNWYEPDHIKLMVETIQLKSVDVVVATRKIMLGNDLYYVDNIESDGRNFADTNCMFLSVKSLHLLSYWVTEPGKKLWSDRSFWNSIVQSKLSVAICDQPTVAYVTKWAMHYVMAGLVPPPDSVWIEKDTDGNLSHIKHKDTQHAS
jgi:glycosyltransferase involved in cell wall biosynthesis